MITSRKKRRQKRSGASAVMTAILLIPILGAAALAIDLGFVTMSRSELQAAADSSAIAGASLIRADRNVDAQSRSRQAAQGYAAANSAGNKRIALDTDADIGFGFWNTQDREFEPPREEGSILINAIRVRLHRDDSNSAGPIRHFLAPFLGIESSDVAVESIAYIPNPGPSSDGIGTRFLIDNEMFDPGLQVFKNPCDSIGTFGCRQRFAFEPHRRS